MNLELFNIYYTYRTIKIVNSFSFHLKECSDVVNLQIILCFCLLFILQEWREGCDRMFLLFPVVFRSFKEQFVLQKLDVGVLFSSNIISMKQLLQ